MNFPNILSVSRIFLSIPIIILFENESYLLSIIFFIIASVTDYLDGFLARKQNLVTKTGALLDLLADWEVGLITDPVRSAGTAGAAEGLSEGVAGAAAGL